MKKQISGVLIVAALAAIAACGSSPTAPAATAANHGLADASAPPADSTGGRVPNLMGSGN
jgi:hypothetical protein